MPRWVAPCSFVSIVLSAMAPVIHTLHASKENHLPFSVGLLWTHPDAAGLHIPGPAARQQIHFVAIVDVQIGLGDRCEFGCAVGVAVFFCVRFQAASAVPARNPRPGSKR